MLMTGLVWITLFATLGAAGETQPWTVQKLVGLDYPRHALSTGLQGRVELLCHIGNDGNVVRVDWMSGNEELAEAADRNARNWKFRRVASGERGYKLVYHFEIQIVTAPTKSTRFRFVLPGDVFITAEQRAVVSKRP